MQARELHNPGVIQLKNGKQSTVVMGLWVAVMLQIVLGTQVREAIEWLSREYPLLNEYDWLEQVEGIRIAHSIYGTLLTGAILWVAKRQIRENRLSPLLRDVVNFSWAIAVSQIGIGSLLVKLGIPQAMQVFHQWMSSLLVGFVMAWFIGLKAAEKRAHARSQVAQPSTVELTV
jgi:Uncharacterized protein required for cytochrome oxidase assembly